MNSNLAFQTGQIVALNHYNACLYADVIQVVETRQVCWVRPLLLVKGLSADYQVHASTLPPVPEPSQISDLRQSPDLIWPIQLFRAALDTEVIPLLAQLESPETSKLTPNTAHQQLREFIRQVWQAYPHVFQDLGNQEQKHQHTEDKV